MYKMVLANFELWPSVALGIFFTFSLALLGWIFRPGSRETYEKIKEDAITE